MIFHQFLAGGLVTALALVAPASTLSSQNTKCRPADAMSDRLIVELRNWMTTTDPERVADRDNVYKIPVVGTNQIALVTDERICGKLIQAYAALSGTYTPASIYVIKMGNKNYTVLDPTDLAGDFRTVMIFDSRYVRVGGWTGG